jgi:Predicted membrane protein
VLDFLVSVAIITFLFAAMFKYLPDVKLSWKSVWPGALLTTVLFVMAKYLLGLYFGNSDPASTYGAAGSVILIMLWVSYSGLILLFGVEFTRVWSKKTGERAKPVEYAREK